MSNAVRIWQITEGENLEELKQPRLDLESRLEDWIEKDISILSTDLMIIGRQVETAFGKYIDLLCIDSQGDLVILELKRDMTPRDTVAQALDYASWVKDLSRDAVCEIADTYFKKEGGLEEAFRSAYSLPLPEVLNDSHRMVIVASSMDASTERIVRYLSDVHGVGINVAEFKYHQDSTGHEYVSRVFLVEPEAQQDRIASGQTTKRRRRISLEELEAVADENGVGDIYRYLDEHCTGVFDVFGTTRTSLAFQGRGFMESGEKKVIFSLIPTQSEPGRLKFQVYLWRLARFLRADEAAIAALLPIDRHEWSYGETDDREWTGFEGAFSSMEEAVRFVTGITSLQQGTAR